mmetsp:Transcript_24983/g.41651  ORF Transcript_24983/g.41651 Transcript_24983/m.41651 type:complete len:87 (+) Transcript_24983:1613-1873(+)
MGAHSLNASFRFHVLLIRFYTGGVSVRGGYAVAAENKIIEAGTIRHCRRKARRQKRIGNQHRGVQSNRTSIKRNVGDEFPNNHHVP